MEEKRKEDNTLATCIASNTRMQILTDYMRATEYKPDTVSLLVIMGLADEAIAYRKQEKESLERSLKEWREKQEAERNED